MLSCRRRCFFPARSWAAVFRRSPRIGAYDNSQFYDGARRGAQGGNYGGGNYHGRKSPIYDNRNQGGIGPGKGALIGGAAGAVLGAVFGGGVKGSLITGAAGAGHWRHHRPICAGQSRQQQLLPPLGEISMKNRYAAVLWVATPAALRCHPGEWTTGVFGTEPAPNLDHRSGGDVLRPRRVGTGRQDRGGIFRHCESPGGAFRAKARAWFCRIRRRSAVSLANTSRRRRKPITISYCMRSWTGRCVSTGPNLLRAGVSRGRKWLGTGRWFGVEGNCRSLHGRPGQVGFDGMTKGREALPFQIGWWSTDHQVARCSDRWIRTWGRSSPSWHAPCSGGLAPPGRWSGMLRQA